MYSLCEKTDNTKLRIIEILFLESLKTWKVLKILKCNFQQMKCAYSCKPTIKDIELLRITIRFPKII